jgi:hypothetical protein
MKIAFYIILLVLALALDGLPGSCVKDSTAVRALETQGYGNVTVIEKNTYFVGFRGGSGSDAAKFTCKAKNPAGKEVTVYVYSGWPFKGSTVRTD